MAQHGDAKAQTTLALLDDDPVTYCEAVQCIRVNLATQNPAGAQAGQATAEQAGLVRQDGAGQITVSGNVYGIVAQHNRGTIMGTSTVGSPDQGR